MTRTMGWLVVALAAVGLTIVGANDVQARHRRGGSDGGYGSAGGGGSFGGNGSAGGNGSWGGSTAMGAGRQRSAGAELWRVVFSASPRRRLLQRPRLGRWKWFAWRLRLERRQRQPRRNL